MLDQGSRGVTAALLWLRGAPDRRIEIRTSGSLRLDTCNGQTCEILSAENLPGLGEECFLRQCFPLESDREGETRLLLHLLWGSDISPRGNTSLCALPLELDEQNYPRKGYLCLAVRLRRAPNGLRLLGAVYSTLGGVSATLQRRLVFTQEIESLFSLANGNLEEKQ
jgi:hypothetical protein